MRTEQIIYLEEIHRYASINKAAEHLHLSPQALSLSLNALEKELTVQLVIRNRNGTFLTQQGLEILSAGQAFLDQLENIIEMKERKYPLLIKEKIDVMLTNGVAETFFPSAISQLFIDYPDLNFNMERLKFDDIIAKLALSESELGFIYYLSIDGHDLTDLTSTVYHFTPLKTGSYYCICHQKFALAQFNRVSLKTLLTYPVIIYSPTKALIKNLLEYAGHLQNIIYVDDFSLYRQMLKDGVGIGLYFVIDQPILPDTSLAHLNLIPFKEDIRSSLGYIHQNNAPLSPKAQSLVDYLKDFYDIRIDKAFTFI